jgi:hypothetical protein
LGPTCQDAVVDLGIDMVPTGPIAAAVLPRKRPAGASSSSAPALGVEGGYLPAAVSGWRARDVVSRLSLTPACPEDGAAECWLQQHRCRLLDGPTKLLRDGSPPASSHAGHRHHERVDPWEDEGFTATRWPSLGFASWAATFFLDLRAPGWRCCAVDGDEPLAYVAMHVHDGVAVLALASRLVKERDGFGQARSCTAASSMPHREVQETIAVAEAGCERRSDASLVRAGFEDAVRTFTWQPCARVPM